MAVKKRAPKKPKKKEVIEVEIGGEVKFQSVDRRAARITLEGEKIIGPRRFEIDRSLLPADYEADKYTVTGLFKIELKVKEK